MNKRRNSRSDLPTPSFARIIVVLVLLTCALFLLLYVAYKLIPNSIFLADDVHVFAITLVSLIAGVLTFGLFHSTANFSRGKSGVTGIAAFIVIFVSMFTMPFGQGAIFLVKGAVRTESNMPIKDARVWIPGYACTPSPARTDDLGNFSFQIYEYKKNTEVEFIVRPEDGEIAYPQTLVLTEAPFIVTLPVDWAVAASLIVPTEGETSVSLRYRIQFASFTSPVKAAEAQDAMKMNNIECVLVTNPASGTYSLSSTQFYSYDDAKVAVKKYSDVHYINAKIIPLEN